MTPWKAIIAKARTADGNWVLETGFPFKVGMTIEIDLASRKNDQFVKTSTQKTYWTEIVNLIDPQNPHGPPMYFPTEMLALRCKFCDGTLVKDEADMRCDTCLEINVMR
jgi:hypothetical protein